MQRIPLLILAFTILIVAAKVPAFPTESAAPDSRYERCMGKEPCTDKEDLQSLDELTDNMRKDLRRIELICAQTGYKDCFNPATDNVAEWHKMHKRMDDVARILESRYTSARADGKQLNLIEPAAGPVPTPNPYTKPDQENLREDKRDWWHGEGWAPPDEDNPYHKW